MKKITCFISIVFIGFNLLFAQKGLLPEHLSEIKMVNEVSVSDNGNYVAYTLIIPKSIEDGIGTRYSELHVFDIVKNENISLKKGEVNISSLSWMPDNDKICFRQNTDETNGNQVFSLDISSGEITQLTDFERTVNSYQFINSDELLFVARQTISDEREALNEKGIDIKIFEEELLHIELYRYNIQEQTSEIIIKDITVYDFEISPDGTKIALAVSEKNLIDYYYMFQRIHIIDLKTGEIIKIFDNPGKLGKMAWCPDSKKLAFISASDLYDSVCGSLFILDPKDKEQSFSDLKNLVEGLELSVIDIAWEDSENILYAAEESVDIGLTRLNINDMSRETVLAGGKIVYSRFFKSDENIFFAGNTWQYPNELIQYDLKNKKINKLTDHNSWLAEIELSKQEKITYFARDGKDIDGVLVYPLDYKEGKKYPLIVYIHGGPEACVKNGWQSHYSRWGQFASSKGFFVFSPNYRASSGRGVDFTMVGFGDLLGVEYDDVLDGIDYLIETGMVDKNKVGIGGGSYGGYFAAYSATKHTDRFAASVVFVGIANQVSKRKITDIPYEDYYVHWGFWTHENHDKVWNASPVKYAHKSKTPTLILHGEEDPRIPVSQGLELYRALKLHGKAPVRFVLYPGEGHGNAKNINRYDYLLRTLEWFEYYLITNPGSKEMPDKYIDYNIN